MKNLKKWPWPTFLRSLLFPNFIPITYSVYWYQLCVSALSSSEYTYSHEIQMFDHDLILWRSKSQIDLIVTDPRKAVFLFHPFPTNGSHFMNIYNFNLYRWDSTDGTLTSVKVTYLPCLWLVSIFSTCLFCLW